MKTSLLISGQFRFVEETFPLISKNIIEPNDIDDIFIHGWYDENHISKPYKYGGSGGWVQQRIHKNSHLKAIELYKPKLFKIDEEKRFINSSLDFSKSIERYYKGGPENEPDYRNRMINNMFSMWYSIQQSFLLCQEYKTLNDLQYDCIIRLRFDTQVNHPILVNQYDQNKMHYCFLNQIDGMISDWINFSSYDNISIMCSIFNVIELLIKRSLNIRGTFCNEILLKEILDIYNIEREPHQWFITLPRF